MGTFLHAVEVFLDHLSSIAWGALALAILCHLAKTLCRTMAWRNIVAAAYPRAVVRWRDIAGAQVAGVGVNAILPARGGDLVRLYIAKHRVEGASYPTLASTLVVETIFDSLAALALFGWALYRGALPGLDVLPRLDAFDLAWIGDHPVAFSAIALGAVGLATVLGFRYGRRVGALGRRVAQGFAVLGDWRLYLRSVVTWQAADWVFRILTIVFFLNAFGIGVGLGIEVNLDRSLLVQVAQSASTLVPLTPAGIGTEQALVVYVLGSEAPVGALLGFSVGMQLVITVVNVIVGFGVILLMLGTVRWRRHIELSEGIETPTLLGSPPAAPHDT